VNKVPSANFAACLLVEKYPGMDTGKIKNVVHNCHRAKSHGRLGGVHSGQRVQQIDTTFVVVVVEHDDCRFHLLSDITEQPRCIVLSTRTDLFFSSDNERDLQYFLSSPYLFRRIRIRIASFWLFLVEFHGD